MAKLDPELRRQLHSTTDKFLTEQYDFHTRQSLIASDLGYSKTNWSTYAELGWLGIPFDEQFGGIGGDVTDTLEMMRLFGRHLVVEPFMSTVGLVGAAIAEGENEPLKESVLPRLIGGEVVAALALEEPGSRGNPAFVETQAHPEGGGFRVQGEKIAVLNAPQADYLLVSARTSGELLDEEGISLFLAERNQDGVQLTAYPTVDGHRAANISLDVWVDSESLVTGEGQAHGLLTGMVNNGLMMLCAEAVGIMQALLDTTVEYSNTRKQFGVSLSMFQVLRHRMVDMYIEWQRSNALLDLTATRSQEGVPDSRALHLLKAQVGRSGRVIGDSAIQLHGGIGMTDELIVGHYVKRLVAISQLLGNTDFHLKQAWESANA